MLQFAWADFSPLLGQFLWPLFRVTSFFMAAPILGTQVVNARARLMLGLLVTIVLVPVLPALPPFDGLAVSTYLLVGQQVLIGVLLGFCLQLLFQVFVLAGHMVAMNMGMGFSSMVDPTNGISVVAISQFYLIMTTLLFVASNGHLLMIEVLANSFRVMPIDQLLFPQHGLWRLVSFGTWMFASAFVLAIPLVVTLLIANFAFGVMAKSSPQLNVFVLGFPFTLLLGLVILWLTTSSVVPQYSILAEEVFQRLDSLMQP